MQLGYLRSRAFGLQERRCLSYGVLPGTLRPRRFVTVTAVAQPSPADTATASKDKAPNSYIASPYATGRISTDSEEDLGEAKLLVFRSCAKRVLLTIINKPKTNMTRTACRCPGS